jgi:hypothetical protein
LPWRVTVRRGPKVERTRRDSLPEALELLEARARALAGESRRPPLEALGRRYEPAQLVTARAELRGPQRLRPDVRAGVDVRGDGSVIAWTGGVRRAALDPERGETPYAALRRTLTA